VAARSRPQHPYLDWPGPIPLAHRGGASEAPENTLPAFQRAVDLGYRYLETDVHVTRDGVVVAFHDDDLSRTCGRPGLIHELTWAEVATARVAGTEPIPRLDELLAAFPEARFNIDCKTDRAVDPLGDVLARTGALDRVCVGAFSDRRLRQLRARFGERLCTSAGPLEIGVLKFVHVALRGPMAAQVPVRTRGVTVVTRSFVAACHRRGIGVHVWTVDDPDEMARLLDLGVDGLMTDVPATLKELLVARGQWVD
jgi:glycerophosphoryl diester phosphodiesterase